MTAIQLILFNVVIIGGIGLLVYAMTHGKKHNKQSSHLKHN